jgi:hypothetical protein
MHLSGDVNACRRTDQASSTEGFGDSIVIDARVTEDPVVLDALESGTGSSQESASLPIPVRIDGHCCQINKRKLLTKNRFTVFVDTRIGYLTIVVGTGGREGPLPLVPALLFQMFITIERQERYSE